MNKYNTFLHNLILTKNRLSNVSESERRELCKLYIETYGFFLSKNPDIINLLINIFSHPDGLADQEQIEIFKKYISKVVDDDLIRSFTVKSDIKSKSKNNENPF